MSSFRHTSPIALVALLAALAAACGSSPGMTTPPPAEDDASFTLALSTDKLPVLQGATARLEVTVTRKAGFTGAVTLSDVGLPAGTSFAPVTIGADQTKATLVATAITEAPHSLPAAVTIRGTSGTLKAEKPLTVTVYGAPGTLDTSFAGGKVVVPVGAGDDYAFALAVQGDGKLLVAGRAGSTRAISPSCGWSVTVRSTRRSARRRRQARS